MRLYDLSYFQVLTTGTTMTASVDDAERRHQRRPRHQPSQTLTYFIPTSLVPTPTHYRSSSTRYQNTSSKTLPFSVWTSQPSVGARSYTSIYNSSSTSSPSSTSENDGNPATPYNEIKGANIPDSEQPATSSIPSTSDDSKNWRPLKSWFPQQTPSVDPLLQSPVEKTQSSNDPSELNSANQPTDNNPSNIDDLTPEQIKRKDRSEEPFRWPWQNGNGDDHSDPAVESNGVSSSTKNSPEQGDPSRVKKRVQHTDSKPGPISLDGSTESDSKNNKPPNKSVPDRWKELVEAIIHSKEQSNEQGKFDADDVRTTNNISKKKQKVSTDGSALPSARRNSGIFELYKPPTQSKKKRQSGQSGDKKKPWFAPPWSRDSKTSLPSDSNSVSSTSSVTSASNSEQLGNNGQIEPVGFETKSDEFENNIAKDGDNESSKEKPWFSPPWKRNAEDSDKPRSGGKDENKDETNLTRRDSASEQDSKSKETKKEKIKVTFPSRKPWYLRPGKQLKEKIAIHNNHNSEAGNNQDKTGTKSTITADPPTTDETFSKTERQNPDSSEGLSTLQRSDENNENDKNWEQNEKELVASESSKGNGNSNSSHHPSLDMYSIPQRDISRIRQIFGSETFFATDTIPAPGGLLFHGNLRGEPEAAVNKLEERLSSRFGDKYTLCLAEGEDQGPVVVVVPTSYHQISVAPRHRLLSLGLAMMTISTCLSRGLVANGLRSRIISAYGLPAKLSLIQRLLSSPLGGTISVAMAIGMLVILSQVVVRRIVASRYRTKLAMPFMLPSYQLGSFGAVVYLVSPAPSRAALFDIAISSTIALVIPAMICLIVGLRLSTSFAGVFPVPMSMVSGSLLMGIMTRFVPNGQILVDYQRSLIGLHPLAIIGANCLTIAALNLLPIRQLDGSRIIASLFGRRAAVRAWRMAVLYVLFASSRNPFLIMFLLIVSFGPWQVDRPSRNELTEPDNVRTIVGYLFMLLMITLLLPYPKSSFFGTL